MKTKNLLLILLFLPVSHFLSAQVDTIAYSQEEALPGKIKFIDAYENVFLTQEENKFLVKINALSLLDFAPNLTSFISFFNPRIETAVEYKISKDLSINSELELKNNFQSLKSRALLDTLVISGEPAQFVDVVANSHNIRAKLQVELRWYFLMKNRIKKGLAADNLVGTYVSAYYGRQLQHFRRQRLTEFLPALRGNATTNTFGIRIGSQRRIFENGYIDLFVDFSNVSGEVLNFPNGTNHKFYTISQRKVNPSFFLNTGVKIGYAIGKVSDRYDPNKCEVLKCYQEKNSLVKVDLLNAVRFINSGWNGNFSVGYEQKIGKSPFSLGVDLEFIYSSLFFTNEGKTFFSLINLRGTLALEGRYYYNLRKRIATGKSANNLFANYVSLFYKNNNVININGTAFSSASISPSWGMQRGIFNFVFMDVKFGFQAIHFYGGSIRFALFDEGVPNTFFSEFKLGLVF